MSSDESHEPFIRVMALHALMHCERLFYLEEVEEIRIADASVYTGRRLHEELAAEEGEMASLVLESERLGLKGKVDCLRRRNGQPKGVEHKEVFGVADHLRWFVSVRVCVFRATGAPIATVFETGRACLTE
jgi:CRISPR-associated protein Cas1